MTLAALEYLVAQVKNPSELEIVARWRGQDLMSGATDIAIYPFLKEMKVPLYVHNTIHLKLLVFDRSKAFHSSGNITRNGLGLKTAGNIEVGCDVTLQKSDWRHIQRILTESDRVDDAMYEQAKRYIEMNKTNADIPPPLVLKDTNDKEFSWLSLPSTSSPEDLWRYYSDSLPEDEALDIAAAASKDLAVFTITDGLDGRAFHNELEAAFKAHPFIRKFVEMLASEESLRFGAVKQWLQENCSDKPQPYRRDLNDTVRNLYNWLQHYYDEITWDRPNHSMIIYWKSA